MSTAKPLCGLIITIGAQDIALPDIYKAEMIRELYEAVCLSELKQKICSDIDPARLDSNLIHHIEVLLAEYSDQNKKAVYWGKRIKEDLAKSEPPFQLTAENFPIITPLWNLKDTLENTESPGHIRGLISQVWLLATNSPNGHSQDSFLYAEFVKNHLLEPGILPALAENGVKIIELKADAFDYDLIFYEIYTELKNDSASFEQLDRIYVAITAGTPAMSWSALQAGSRLFSDKLYTLYTQAQNG